MKALLFLATGFEEIEAMATSDILRRAEIDFSLVSITGNKAVVGAHQISVVADYLFEEADLTSADMLVLPGGMPGAANLNAHEGLKDLILEYDKQGKYLAAICAAPLVFGGLGLLQGKKAICYPGFEGQLTGATIEDQPVVQDGNIITGKGPALACQFGLKLISVLCGQKKVEELKKALLFC